MFKRMPCIFRIAGITLALVWCFQVSATAGIYKWIDEEGRPHYTDDKSTVPKKHRPHLKKFKGIQIKKKEPEEEASAEEGSAEMAAPPETQASAQQPPQQNPPAKSTRHYSKEEKIVMTMVYKSLLKIWALHVRLLRDHDLDSKGLKQYIRVVETSYTQKKQMYKDIGKWKTPILLDVRSYLKKTIRKDRRFNKDTEDKMAEAKKYNKRLMREIPLEREFLESFNVELGLGAKPLPRLEDELKKAEARRKAKEKKKPTGDPNDMKGLTRPG